MKKTLLALSLAGLFATSAQAESDNLSQFYISASVGQATFDEDFNELEDLGASVDDSDTAFKFAVGYDFNEYFSVEAGYADLGELAINNSYSDYYDADFNITYNENIAATVSGLFASVIGKLPINEEFSLFAKVGYYSWDSDIDVAASVSQYVYGENYKSSAKESDSLDGNDPFFGIGTQYAFDEISIKAEYEIFDIEDSDVNVLTVGASYHF
ncbi:outer membrane beta-barrel protein [Catenovulum sp. SM1970]|uniref:outer membrane beta-barrel protein n=1 Tax=Marinifaba aquimaris TaxID=2741323 RepID=UPI001573E02D|nr:outer membrane beta-barrel protein [Marinifaba aquimaris]NTS76195.1 outer membrane beta-barrel protein [Marinifaba aquimaris]